MLTYADVCWRMLTYGVGGTHTEHTHIHTHTHWLAVALHVGVKHSLP